MVLPASGQSRRSLLVLTMLASQCHVLQNAISCDVPKPLDRGTLTVKILYEPSEETLRVTIQTAVGISASKKNPFVIVRITQNQLYSLLTRSSMYWFFFVTSLFTCFINLECCHYMYIAFLD